MPRRNVNGPTAILAAVGAVLALMGFLVLLAVPAARQLDVRESERNATQRGTVRRDKITVSGAALLVGGLGMVGAGIVLAKRRGPKGRPQ